MTVKAGDRVREISTGDEGFVATDANGDVKYGWNYDWIYVNWYTGLCKGKQLHVNLDCIELCTAPSNKEVSVEEALAVLTKAGYTVSISKNN